MSTTKNETKDEQKATKTSLSPEAPVVDTQAETDDEVLEKLPKGAMTLAQAIAEASDTDDDIAKNKLGQYKELPATGASGGGIVSSTFDDEFAGRGGTFAFDKEGNRVRVHEEIVDEDGNSTYRPIK